MIYFFVFLFPIFVFGRCYQLAICSMIQNEAPWLEEWIEYHKLLGVDHFYLYDNESSDVTYEVLSPYIEEGLVEVTFWSTTPSHCDPLGNVFDRYQLTAFNDCAQKAKGVADFLAVMDVDEYLVPVKGKSDFWNLLRSKQNKNVGSFEFHWLIYGTSHVWEIPEKKVMVEVLTKRAPDSHPWYHNTKCIHRPEAIETCWVHNATLKPGYRKVDVSFSEIRINHYWTRDQKSWIRKRIGFSLHEMKELKHVLTADRYRHIMDVHEREFNRIEDRAILRFVPSLKKNLKRSSQ